MNDVRNENSSPHSAKFLRQRKFLLVLPVLVLPFFIFLLWTLGLVGEVKAGNKVVQQQNGFNIGLPSAAPAKDSNWNKMKYYEQAAKDSARLKNQLKNDPYRKMDVVLERERIAADTLLAGNKSNSSFRYSYDPYPKEKLTDHNEERVYKKLAALNKELETAAAQDQKSRTQQETRPPPTANIHPDVERLESMMKAMQQAPEEDTELKQLNELLEKVMDVQHPERMEDKIRQQSEQNKRQVFAVQRKQEDIISVLKGTKDWKAALHGLPDTTIQHVQAIFNQNRFYSLDEEKQEEAQPGAIAAVIHEAQTLMTGATVKLRLLEDVFIAGVAVAKDQLVYGTATLNGERLEVKINSIRSGNAILPVSLSVYDMDGIPGIYMPGAISRDVAKRSMTQSVQNMGSLNSLDPSLGAQVAGAGLQAAQNLLTKKAKLVKVYVKAGYQVLLKDDNLKDK